MNAVYKAKLNALMAEHYETKAAAATATYYVLTNGDSFDDGYIAMRFTTENEEEAKKRFRNCFPRKNLYGVFGTVDAVYKHMEPYSYIPLTIA